MQSRKTGGSNSGANSIKQFKKMQRNTQVNLPEEVAMFDPHVVITPRDIDEYEAKQPKQAAPGKKKVPKEAIGIQDQDQPTTPAEEYQILQNQTMNSPENSRKLESTRIIRKGAATAPRGVKRPQVPPINQFQAAPQSFVNNPLNSKQEKNLLKYIQKRMKPGEAAQMSGAPGTLTKPLYKQYAEEANRNFDIAHFKNRKKSKKRAMEAARHKSAPRRFVQRMHDVQRSVPNQAGLNRLVQKVMPKKFQDDEQILNINISKGGKKNHLSQMKVTQSQRMFDNIGTRTQTINFKGPRMSINDSRKKNKSPNHKANAFAFAGNLSTSNAGKLNDTIGSHRAQLQGVKGGYQQSESSFYRGLHDSRFMGSGSVSGNPRLKSSGSQASGLSMGSNAQSELVRQKQRLKGNKKRKLNLDKHHLQQLKEPESIRNPALLHPEGYSTDHKKDLEIFSQVAKKKATRREPDDPNPMRASSAQSTMRQGLHYKFKLEDLSKYSSKLKYKDINWKIKLSALGKQVPDVKERKKILIKGSHFNTLLKILRQTDWSSTQVYA